MIDSNGLRVVIKVGDDVAQERREGESVWLLRLQGFTSGQVQAIPSLTRLQNDLGALPGLTKQQTVAFARTRQQIARIGAALANFDDTHGRLPPGAIYGPDGKPWHSWRVFVLPFLDENRLFEQYRFDEPWNGPNNEKLIDKIPCIYQAVDADGELQPHTHFVLPVGDNAPYREIILRKRPPAKLPLELPTLGRKLGKDWMLVTMAAGKRIPWTKPEDLKVAEDLPDFGRPGGFAAPFEDDTSRFGLFSFNNLRLFGVAIRTSIREEQFLKLKQGILPSPWQQIPRYEPPRIRRGVFNPLVMELQTTEGQTSARLFYWRF